MPRTPVPSRSHAWPRVAVLALIGVSAAACSDSARVNNYTFSSRQSAPPPQEVTGSIAPRPAPTSRVVAQPLPAVSQPATVAASQGGTAYGGQGLGAYRPNADVTGSVPQPQPQRYAAASAPPPPPPPAPPAGHWTWDGGSPVTVGHGETIESIARKNGVPAAALMETNGMRNAGVLRPGQRLVIPRYVSGGAPQPSYAQAPSHLSAPQVAAVRAPAGESVHIVQPGESLIGIARKHGLTLVTLARANKIQPYTKVSIGDRLTIPGGQREIVAAHQTPVQPQPMQQVAARQAPAPQLTQPRAAPPVQKVETVPAQNARVVTPEPATTETVTKTADAGMPSFRWPVKGRVIAAFGSKPNGTQNDGINLAVPEGTPVKAAEDGVVAYAGNELKGYGNLVLVRHANGFVSAYANASELLVKRGDTVKRGQTIAHAGQTGNVTSPQLHFEIRKGSTPVDPTKYLGGA